MTKGGTDCVALTCAALAWLYAKFTADPFGTYAVMVGAVVITIRAVIAVADLIARFRKKREQR